MWYHKILWFSPFKKKLSILFTIMSSVGINFINPLPHISRYRYTIFHFYSLASRLFLAPRLRAVKTFLVLNDALFTMEQSLLGWDEYLYLFYFKYKRIFWGPCIDIEHMVIFLFVVDEGHWFPSYEIPSVVRRFSYMVTKIPMVRFPTRAISLKTPLY